MWIKAQDLLLEAGARVEEATLWSNTPMSGCEGQISRASGRRQSDLYQESRNAYGRAENHDVVGSGLHVGDLVSLSNICA